MVKLIKYCLFFCLISTSFAQSGLSVHGFLTQAVAISDSYQIFGIPKEGTFDYRTLALQFRYDIDAKNSTIVQFSHRRIGKSHLMELEGDMKIDWAFFEHKLNNNLGFKIGKILIPFGLYNEIRDVGILMPFYREPYPPYTMGSYLSETVNGVSAYYLYNYSDWHFNLDLYIGNWNWTTWYNQQDPFGDGVIPVDDISRITNGVGAKLNISTPYEGVNFGGSWQRGLVSGELFFSNNFGGIGKQDYNLANLFIVADFSKYYLKSEYSRSWFTQGDFYLEGASIMAGINLFYQLYANFLYEFVNLRDVPNYDNDNPNILKNRRDSDYLRDFAFGLNYKFSSNVILKSEIHLNKSLAYEDVYVHVFNDEPKHIKYFILSLSTSF